MRFCQKVLSKPMHFQTIYTCSIMMRCQNHEYSRDLRHAYILNAACVRALLSVQHNGRIENINLS